MCVCVCANAPLKKETPPPAVVGNRTNTLENACFENCILAQ